MLPCMQSWRRVRGCCVSLSACECPVDSFSKKGPLKSLKGFCCCLTEWTIMLSLREQLTADSKYFKHMLNLIPAGYCCDSAGIISASATQSSRNTSSKLDKYSMKIFSNIIKTPGIIRRLTNLVNVHFWN